MPYLDPGLIVNRFARFTREEIRPAVSDDDFVHAQVGSMASTLQFLAGELGGREEAVRAQRETLSDCLDELEAVLDQHQIDSPSIRTAIDNARNQIDVTEDSIQNIERASLAAADDIFVVIEEELEEDQAAVARQPLYEFLQTRVDQQLRLLGREADE